MKSYLYECDSRDKLSLECSLNSPLIDSRHDACIKLCRKYKFLWKHQIDLTFPEKFKIQNFHAFIIRKMAAVRRYLME